MPRVVWCQRKTKKADVLIAVFAAVFNTKASRPQDTQLPEVEVSGPMIQASDLLCKLDNHPTMGLNGMNSRVMKELAKELTNPLSIIYQQSWLSGEVAQRGDGVSGSVQKVSGCDS